MNRPSVPVPAAFAVCRLLVCCLLCSWTLGAGPAQAQANATAAPRAAFSDNATSATSAGNATAREATELPEMAGSGPRTRLGYAVEIIYGPDEAQDEPRDTQGAFCPVFAWEREQESDTENTGAEAYVRSLLEVRVEEPTGFSVTAEGEAHWRATLARSERQNERNERELQRTAAHLERISRTMARLEALRREREARQERKEAQQRAQARPKPVAATVAAATEAFREFAAAWLRKNQENYCGSSPSEAEVLKEGDGYLARYYNLDWGTLELTVKPTESAATPFVGVMRYVERRYEARAESDAAVRAAPFSLAKALRITEIFMFSGGRWKE